MALEIVNEGSSAYLTVAFLDRQGNAAAPVAVTYRIDDIASGTPIRAETSVSAGPTVELHLSPADHAILDAAHPSEKRRVTIVGTYGADDAVTAQYDYLVRNLSRVP